MFKACASCVAGRACQKHARQVLAMHDTRERWCFAGHRQACMLCMSCFGQILPVESGTWTSCWLMLCAGMNIQAQETAMAASASASASAARHLPMQLFQGQRAKQMQLNQSGERAWPHLGGCAAVPGRHRQHLWDFRLLLQLSPSKCCCSCFLDLLKPPLVNMVHHTQSFSATAARHFTSQVTVHHLQDWPHSMQGASQQMPL